MKVTVAATQMACGWDREANIANAERLIREAAKQGANVVLIQELFEARTSARTTSRSTSSSPCRWRRTLRSGGSPRSRRS